MTGEGQAVLARPRWALRRAENADPRVVTMVQAPFEAAIATGVDLGDPDRTAAAESGADERRAGMMGAVLAAAGAAAGVRVEVGARLTAGLDVQVLGDTTGDVGRPACIAMGVSQRLGQMKHVHAVGGGEIGKQDHVAEASARWATQEAQSQWAAVHPSLGSARS